MMTSSFAEYTPAYSRFVKAFLAGNLREMNRYMNQVAMDTFSFFDTGNRPSERIRRYGFAFEGKKVLIG